LLCRIIQMHITTTQNLTMSQSMKNSWSGLWSLWSPKVPIKYLYQYWLSLNLLYWSWKYCITFLWGRLSVLKERKFVTSSQITTDCPGKVCIKEPQKPHSIFQCKEYILPNKFLKLLL
jgi:hypothetical protein